MYITPETKILVLTGAGISAESGLQTFRDPGGLWDRFDWRELATPEAFAKKPGLVWDFYLERRRLIKEAQPSPAHRALAKLERYLDEGCFTLISQNVDNLHERAGSMNMTKIHGSAMLDRCTKCGYRSQAQKVYDRFPPICPECESVLRPDVVWFGEELNSEHLKLAMQRLLECDLFIVIGTAGNVFPISQFVYETQADKIYIGVEEPENADAFQKVMLGKAGVILPELINEYCEV